MSPIVDTDTGEVFSAPPPIQLEQPETQMQALHSTEAELELMEQICEIQQIARVSSSGSYRGSYSTEGDINRFVRDFLTPRGIVVRTNAIEGGREVVEVAKKKSGEYIRELHNRVWGKFQFVISNGKAAIEHVGYGDWVQDNGLPQFSSVMTNAWRNFMIKTFALEGANDADTQAVHIQPPAATQQRQTKPKQQKVTPKVEYITSNEAGVIDAALNKAKFPEDKAKRLQFVLWLVRCPDIAESSKIPLRAAQHGISRLEKDGMDNLLAAWEAEQAEEAMEAGQPASTPAVDAPASVGVTETPVPDDGRLYAPANTLSAEQVTNLKSALEGFGYVDQMQIDRLVTRVVGKMRKDPKILIIDFSELTMDEANMIAQEAKQNVLEVVDEAVAA